MDKRKFTYSEVSTYFGLFKHELLSSEYKSSQTKLMVRCYCGNIYEVFFNNFYRGHMCKKCADKKWSLKYPDIKKFVESVGYKLLSDSYINSNSKVKVMCPNGHIYEVRYNHFKRGTRCPKCSKGGRPRMLEERMVDLNICLYSVYFDKLKLFENCHLDKKDGLSLNVECSNCGKIYRPSRREVARRLSCFNGVTKGESRFYCSEKCKEECPVYYQKKYRKGESPYVRQRFGSILWRNMVLERDGYTCQKCGKHFPDGVGIDVHHIEATVCAPTLSCDIENGISLCESCHVSVHQQDGCFYQQLSAVS